jgi:outer membrane protein
MRRLGKSTVVLLAAFVIVFVFGATCPLFAEMSPVLLTLNDAIRLAFERNLDLKVELYNPAMAEADIRRSLGMYDPRLTAGASYSRLTNPDSLTLLPLRVDSSSISVVGSRLLPTGATVGAIAGWGRTGNSVDYFSNTFSIFVSQPLLRNFGREATELNIAVSRSGKEESLDRFKARLSDTVAQVRTDYFKLYNLREALEVRKTSLALANRILDETRVKVKAGVLPSMEILNAEFGSAAREKEVVDAERAVRDQMDVLRLSLQLDTTGDIVVADPPTRDSFSVSEEEALALALANRPEIAAQRMTLKIEDLQQSAAKNRVLPELAVSANVGLGGYDSRYNRSFEKTLGADYPAWGVGVQFSYPIGNRQAENDHIKSRLLVEQTRTRLRRMEAGIANEVKAAIRLLRSSFQQLDVTSRGRAYAEDRLKAFEKKNAAGLATTKDVLDVENDLATARGNQIQALVEYNNAITGYWRVTGKLLDQQGIVLGERQADPLYEKAKIGQ